MKGLTLVQLFQSKIWFIPSRKNLTWLPLVALVTTAAFGWAWLGREIVPTPYYHRQVTAAQAMVRGMAVLADYRHTYGPAIAPEDYNQTGLIGVEYSPITTTLAPLWIKRTTANHDVAALVVRLLWEGGVRPGDRVAVGLSSSFPALNLALGAALDAMEVEGIIISSLGASSWGANDPDLTWLDMESLLYQAGVIKHKSIAFSAGGSNDLITGFSQEGQGALLAAVRRQEGELIDTGTLATNIERRLDIYGNGDYAAYVNVGGSLASLGEVSAQKLRPGLQRLQLLPSGVALCSPLEVAQTGVVINLLEVGTLALRYGLPLDPYPLPPVGSGPVYMYKAVPLERLAVALGLSMTALLLPLIVDTVGNRSKEKQVEKIRKGILK